MRKLWLEIQELKKQIACMAHCCDGNGGGTADSIVESRVLLERNYGPNIGIGKTQQDLNTYIINTLNNLNPGPAPTQGIAITERFNISSQNIVGNFANIPLAYLPKVSTRHDLFCRGVLIDESCYIISQQTLSINMTLTDYPIEVGDFLVFKYVR